jgi:hypothetical protein
MNRSLLLALVLLASFSFASGMPVETVNDDEVAVSVASEHLTGILPNGESVEVRLKAELEGDPSFLIGQGRHFASSGAHNYWPATGSMTGTVVTLSGTVTGSNVAFLIGSPVEVEADSATGQIALNFGPLAGGPFAGRILGFTGTGRVEIKGADN